MKVQEYIREDGSSPYQRWFDSLDAIAAAKVTVALSRLELGNTSSVKWFDGIGEYKIDWGQGIEFTSFRMVSNLLSCSVVGQRKLSNLILNERRNCTKSTKGERKRLVRTKRKIQEKSSENKGSYNDIK